jgi:hypothetical protein
MRVTQAIEVLSHCPDGRRLADLATELDRTEGELREEILAYYAAVATVDQLGGGYRERATHDQDLAGVTCTSTPNHRRDRCRRPPSW